MPDPMTMPIPLRRVVSRKANAHCVVETYSCGHQQIVARNSKRKQSRRCVKCLTALIREVA